IYTSGSTGEPKGVIQNHRHLLNRVMLGTHAYHICPYDRLALLASGTGTAINNAFVPLLNGALLDSFAVEKHGVSRLVDWLARERISVCPISPPLFRNIIEALGTGTQLPD